jgi:hypothetical protein
MIAFSPLRTRRLDVQLHELSIGDEIALCQVPENAHEKSMTEFLTRAVELARTPTERHIANPRAWSVSERLMVLAQYCIHVRDDGPDYAVTQVSRLSDYLDASKDAPHQIATFEALDDRWELRPLSGAAVEALEAMQHQIDLKGRLFWIIGAMAAQLLRVGEVIPDPLADFPAYCDWLEKRVEIVRALPSSSFETLYAQFFNAMQEGVQFFRIWFDKEGVIVLPREAGAITPPARFLVHACLGTLALSLAGKA